jgi:uncharacterized cupredoxin-like copper-binding protein
VILAAAAAGAGPGWWDGRPMGTADHMGWTRTGSAAADPPAPGAPGLRIEAGDLWFEPDRVELQAGSTTNLSLENTGRVFHDLSIPDLSIHLEAGAGETASTALRSPEAGSYGFRCTVRGHAAAGMRGELVVTASS